MVTINYQQFGSKGFQLRLRLYQAGETRFINVTKLLKGNIQKRHWNQKKQLFIPSCPYADENNSILVQFRQKYDEMAIKWTGSLSGMVAAMEQEDAGREEMLTVSGFIRGISDEISKRRHPDGTRKGTFECYDKLNRRFIEYCKTKRIKHEKFLITEITPNFVNEWFDWIAVTRNGVGFAYISKMLHSVVMKADKAGHLKADDFKNCNWYKKNGWSAHKNKTLTEEQCRMFATMDLDSVCKSRMNELYRDFCLFILYTGQSPCDAVALQRSNIERINGIGHFVFRRRKIAEKQAVPCCVPINAELERIMNRWGKVSRDGYIFPFRNKEKLKTQATNNGDIKHLIGKLNYWLKKVGAALGCQFPLHTYTFRHTAITRYIEKGVPVVYVANMMGTSVENCEKIYYNNQADISSRNKVLSAMLV
ncbi:MAG: tyrosine-type recombinase/integrase [Muribaculaceae bacterium]|nr:tyrosine-type recombinase/integrase [Muribaculaceae bacterium]